MGQNCLPHPPTSALLGSEASEEHSTARQTRARVKKVSPLFFSLSICV